MLARDGVGALSVRNVAAEAGLPPSSLRYTFPTQASVREHAIALVFDRTRERIERLPAGLAGAGWARAALLELLPLDDERVLEMEAYLALGTVALTDDEFRSAYDRVVEQMRRWCERALRVVGVDGTVLAVETNRLHALVDGLALHLVRLDAAGDGAWAVEVLDRHLAGLAGLAG